MYPISVRDCPGSEHGVFCILIVDLILRSSLVGFSLLRARNCYYRKGQVIVDVFTILAIHGRLFFINLLQSLLPWWDINFFYLWDFSENWKNVALYIELQLYLVFVIFQIEVSFTNLLQKNWICPFFVFFVIIFWVSQRIPLISILYFDLQIQLSFAICWSSGKKNRFQCLSTFQAQLYS